MGDENSPQLTGLVSSGCFFNGVYMFLSGWWLTYPSEKSWSEFVSEVTVSGLRLAIHSCSSHHQPVIIRASLLGWSTEVRSSSNARWCSRKRCAFSAHVLYIYIYLYTCFTAIKLLSCQNHSESTRWSSKQVSKSIFARDIMYILYVANPKKIAVSHFSLFHFQFSHLLPMSIFGGDSQIPPLKAPKSTQINVPFDWLALMSAKGISWGKVLYNGLSSSVDFRCPQWWKCRMVIYIYPLVI